MSRRNVLRTTSGLIGTGGVGALAGCAGSGGGGGGGAVQNGKSVTLTWVTEDNTSTDVEVHKLMAEGWSEASDHEIEFRYADNIAEEVGQMLRGGDVPDIVEGDPSTATGPLVDQDLLEPISDLRSDIEEIMGTKMGDGIVPVHRGDTVAVPHVVKPYHETWRGDVLEEAGITPPETAEERWNANSPEDFLERIRAIDENTDLRGFGFAWSQDTRGSFDGMNLLWSHGVNIFRGEAPDNIEVTLDQGKDKKNAIRAIDFWANEVAPHSVEGAEWTWDSADQAFTTGRIGGITHTSGSMATGINQGRGQEEWIDSLVPMHQIVETERDDGKRNRGSLSQINILKDGNVSVSKEFVKWFLQSDAYLNGMLKKEPLHLAPPTLTQLQSEAYKKDNWLIERRPDLHEFLVKLYEEDVLFAGPLALEGGLNPYFGIMYSNTDLGTMMQRVILEGTDPGTAIDTAAEKIRSYMD